MIIERRIASLLAVFIKNRRQIVKQTGAKNRDHAGVRIEDGLSGSVSARVPQRNGWNPDLFSPEQDQFLLIDFGQSINRFPANRCLLGGGHARGWLMANRAAHRPIAVL